MEWQKQKTMPAAIARERPTLTELAKHRTDKEMRKRYELKQVLGEGTFAVVRLGVDKITRDRVAIKEICKEASEIEALENEVTIMRNTGKHDNIVSLRDVFDSKDTLFLIMDLAEGGELFDRIIERGELSEQAAASMFLSAVEGVAHLHKLNIAHLDIKPENLLLTSKNEDAGIKIADFGLAIDMTGVEDHDARKSEVLCACADEDTAQGITECVGTPAYWAPEMVKNEPFDEKVDIWALGCVLYIMLCGAHPFDPTGDATEAQILAQVAKGDYDKSNQAYHEISRNAKDLIRHMLDPNPSTRYNTDQLLNHPWLRESGKQSSKPLSKDHITKLRGFRIIRLLRQGMEHLVGSAASDLFSSFDNDGDGYLSRSELKRALQVIGIKLSRREVDAMLRMLDKDNDGKISREEFEIVLRAPAGSPYSSVRQSTSLEDISFLFNVFDRDGDGYIQEEDFQHVLSLLGATISASGLYNEMAQIDTDKDGRVDLTEFVTYWRLMERERMRRGYDSVSALHVNQRRTTLRKLPVSPASERPEDDEGGQSSSSRNPANADGGEEEEDDDDDDVQAAAQAAS
ncbi:Protein kinase, putative [Hondaea fermentalgiana]|uniref:Protein kinase, putative n=1 Tax=Hondaea fermentalgiana TaxID=2315210 RepID=A0A2R5GPL0_9STRA|nr:Protein kinase, putative [Hondaea fermentalgiana]|eukprot:GBG30271.1 Protein kinase, putative [Hondaea fermentalgiana]